MTDDTYTSIEPIPATPLAIGHLHRGCDVLLGASARWRCAETFSDRRAAMRHAVVLHVATGGDADAIRARMVPFDAEYRAPAAPLGQVYFIGGEDGPVKIGFSTNVTFRLQALEASSPMPLRVLATTPGTMPDELAYHRRFAEHRLHGEWFARHADILAEIERLNP